MDPSLEIRKLSPSHVRELAKILETHELWKRLMSIIPKKLEQNSFVCNVTLENHHKYNSEHFRLIENASEKYRRSCTEILLDEWGTSGRIRPALGHLLYLLTKAKLFRAADYVAVNLLHQQKPERPTGGPEALIPVPIPEVRRKNDNLDDIEKVLNEINYPGSIIPIIRSNSNEAARNNNAPNVIPQIVISPDIEEDHQAPIFNLPLVVQKEKTSETNNQVISDMMKFSTDSISKRLNETEYIRPVLSDLLANESGSNLPKFDLINGSLQESFTINLVDNIETSDTSEIISDNPALSQLLSVEVSGDQTAPLSSSSPPTELESNTESVYIPNIPNLSALNNSIQIDDLPNLSILNQEDLVSSEENSDLVLPDFSALRNSAKKVDGTSLDHTTASSLLPHSSLLNPSKSLSVNVSTRLLPTSISSDNSTKSRSCTSPLPNLSLNTLLPHFNYSELESATNNFNENPFTSLDEPGRFLGSGAFGYVFIAFGLLDRPVAVKKLLLEDVEVVNVDDMVTKQFQNEVEILSKYKHDNLLSLLGYSCDGCTYCLMYEYIPGGALKERLQVTENKLPWKERLSIAMGTANAIAYLHTAYSTPLIHRDIKSTNILLDSKNKPKLCDFGLIKLQPSQHTNTTTTVFGTSAYMAPEAFSGDISVKLDTFSFGVVLLELLTSLPFLDENRAGGDLVTHVNETCDDNNIMPLVDKGIGSWEEGDINFADELFQIALKCLEEKKKRPNMVEVSNLLEGLLNKLHQ